MDKTYIKKLTKKSSLIQTIKQYKEYMTFKLSYEKENNINYKDTAKFYMNTTLKWLKSTTKLNTK
jgi:hypothetical protein